MRLTLFGASGRTGREIAQQAVERGHTVTAAVRSESSVPALRRALPARSLPAGSTGGSVGGDVHIRVVDVTDPDRVAATVAGHDAVVTAIGPGGTGPTTAQTDTTGTILAAMEQTPDARRLVAVSAAGFHTEGDGLFVRGVVKPILGRFLRHTFADQRAMESLIVASDTDWTLMWPPRLTDGPRTDSYRTARDRAVGGSFSVSRANLAQAVLEVLDDPTTIGHSIAVAN